MRRCRQVGAILEPIGALKLFRTWRNGAGSVAFSVPSSDYCYFKFWALRSSRLSFLIRPIMERYRAVYITQVLPHTHIYNFSRESAARLLTQAGFEPLYVGLTGWHGAAGRVFRPISALLDKLSGGRISFAPSIIAVGRKPP
mgnify:CR=1 FL=1